MKLRNIILVLSGVLLMGLVSCSKTNAVYEPAQKESTAQVYFDKSLQSSYDLSTISYIDVPVSRVNASSAATVTIGVSADAAFNVPTQVSFEAGRDVANVRVTWDDTRIETGKSYQVTMTIKDQTTVYGNSSYTMLCSLPSSWNLFAKGHVTEVCWQEDYDVTMYYQETGYDGIRYCMLKDAWNDITGTAPVPTANYYFYWDTKTNNLFVPLQGIGMQYEGKDICVSDAADFYNANQGWGIVVPSEQYFSWAPGWLAKYGYFQPYYDGNGGFYLADWMYSCEGGVPTGSGWQFGGNPDYFIAEGFVRTVDYNDDDHIGSSAPAYTGTAASEFFSSDDGKTPYYFESGLRYTEPEDEKQETTTYYLPEYFGTNNCLAFTAPVLENLATGSSISDVDNEQCTGLYVFGNQIYVSVSGGSVALKENETAYPIFTINLKVYAKDEDGNVAQDFGTVTEIFSANGILQDNYTLDDLYGGYYEDYLGTWNMTATFESQSGLAEKSYEMQILEKEKNKSFKIVNLSSFKTAFADTVTADYNSSYGILEVHPQALDAKYYGYDVSLGLSDPDSGYWYDSAQVTIYGGICKDGNFAFVNAYTYTGYNICGFYYYVTVSGQASGLCGLYYAWGSYAGASSASKFVKNMRKDYVSLDVEGLPVLTSCKFNKVADRVAAPKTFSLSPVEKKPKAVIQLTPGTINL